MLPLADPKVDIGTLVGLIRDGGLRLSPPRSGEGSQAPSTKARQSPPCCTSPATRSRGARARAGITWGFTRIGVPPWTATSRRRELLEQREQLEQLRALEDGMRISCVRMEHGPFGVDTAEDLERARSILAAA